MFCFDVHGCESHHLLQRLGSPCDGLFLRPDVCTASSLRSSSSTRLSCMHARSSVHVNARRWTGWSSSGKSKQVEQPAVRTLTSEMPADRTFPTETRPTPRDVQQPQLLHLHLHRYLRPLALRLRPLQPLQVHLRHHQLLPPSPPPLLPPPPLLLLLPFLRRPRR